MSEPDAEPEPTGDCPTCFGERLVAGHGPDGLEPCPTCQHARPAEP